MARKSILRTLNVTATIVLVAIFAIPFLWMISTSLKSYPETVIFPPQWIPSKVMWSNFQAAWESGPFLKYLMNSVVVSISILLLQFTTIILAAYAFARYSFKGDKLLFGITMVTLMIPGQLIFLPVYLLLSKWGLINNLLALILPFASSAFGIFMLRQSFKQVQEELIEAARLDQTPEWKIILRIMVPMARPTLVTFALFSFIAHWNDYFWPLVMTTSDAARTLPIGISKLREVDGGAAWHILMAGNMILVVPILIVFLFGQRQIIKAFVYSGVK
ncbi:MULTISPECIES: carbohydrate ABC transporter permease [Paenibacillus]|uniref:Binding-protein-dependent transport systems inner membrane component n=1 Tax=Paenibacillus illinoisensis TaxID=59845 RepID=A0A2W0C0C9_9BACL|nr:MULTISPECIES: carbohydrate ABC transporter permease [Paenibacillus]MBM6387180.1 carbohydrate ABC transporter permease [Paenibacillus sp.]PAD33514.1 sugar ABC transporter permease [Paenibacillus sp. 7523-1]PYY25196.1 Binding-protein-dependent transport systems inner membrane component [Paenibacillus illinoisensis]